MTFADAAAEVLRLVGRPLHYKQITEFAIEKNLLSHVGKSPENMMGVRLAALVKKDTPENPLIRVKPGIFALREWDEKTIKAGLEQSNAPVREKNPPADVEGAEEAAPAVAAAPALDPDDEPLITNLEDDEDEESRTTLIPAPKRETEEAARAVIPKAARSQPTQLTLDDGEDVVDGPEDAMRAELVAAAADVFDEEDDDDQPILGGDSATGDAASNEGRRRRRRRRRGRGGAPEGATPGGQGLPSYTAVPVDDRRSSREQGPRESGQEHPRQGGRGRDYESRSEGARAENGREPRADVPDFLGNEGPALDDLSGREFADAVYSILSTFDRANGPVSLRQIAETVQRRGRLNGEGQLVQSQVAAAVRADNQKRVAGGLRPRFRFAGGRVGLTDWLLGSELASLEAEAVAAVERYRDAARRAFARKLNELPGHAFVELAVLVLEKMGVRELRALRRPGAPGFESHFSAVLKTPLESVRIAVVIRRDGREVGRERVTELRGALHHYQSGSGQPATMGFIFTAGQVLSGAREEASAPGAASVALYDGLAIARLCEEHEVAVLTARMPIAIPDVDLLEALRAS